ncbi:sigma factor [Edaphobacter aggregans]|uniref:RNA polymerase sigma factor n=1 Tax=Edaphobacter aggregans TaxID=570835 RepID=UPI0009FD31D5
MNAILDLQSRSEDKTISTSQEKLEALDIMFSRYRRALSLVAYRVLGNHEEAEDAVQNCLRTAADNVPRLENEGAFRCWLVRVVIDQAVLLLRKQSETPVTWCAPSCEEGNGHRSHLRREASEPTSR